MPKAKTSMAATSWSRPSRAPSSASNNVVSKKGTAVASKVVDISSAVGRFETFTVTLDGLSPTSRIAFSSNPAQAGANKTRYLLDDIVVVYDGETRLEKLTVPANVKFDAEAVYSDKLTLEWDEVAGAASYTVAWWADGTEEKDATVAEGITSASYLLKELEAGTEYHAKVKACRYNNPDYDSDYSAAVSQKTDIAPVQAGIVVSKVLATSSTLTVEWARADGQACVNSSAQVYHVKLYSDAECKDLVVGWNASNVFGITAGNRFRFTFSGLAPATTYYVCVDDKTNDFFSDPLAYATAAAGPQAGATTAGSAKAGDILLAEDFSRVIHGGDIANFAAGYYPPSSNRGTYAAASGDNPSGFSATRCTANEFDVFSGGGVAAPYTEGTGLAAWGKSGNIAGRPGYVKMGAGSAAASLYTPELTALPDAATVKVRFSAQAYSEKYDGSGADAGKILVKAVRGAVLGAKGAITGTVTEVSAADPVDISAAKARFREFEATLTNVTPDCRIVISTSEKRALLDNVVVTCTAITPATKPAAPGGVSFDAAAAADRLTLKWNAVPDATSYTVAYWKGSASAPESEYAYKTGIASTATSQELTNLESNTSYWAKVKAVGSLDSDWSETANATTMDSGGEPLLPTADLLDVVFRNDGSAMDNSPSATPVRALEGTAMMTYYNDLYSRYAAHFNHTPGTSVNEGFYKADYSANKQFQDALADGHTLEALFKLDEKSDGSAELKMFSSMSSGGTGFPDLQGRQGYRTDLPAQRQHDGEIQLDMDEERHQPRGGALLPRRGRMEQAGGQDLHLRRRRAEGYDGCPGQLRAAHHHDELLVRHRRRRQCDRGSERLERRRGHRTRLRCPAHGRKGEGSVGNRQTRPAARRDQHHRAALPFGLRGRCRLRLHGLRQGVCSRGQDPASNRSPAVPGPSRSTGRPQRSRFRCASRTDLPRAGTGWC